MARLRKLVEAYRNLRPRIGDVRRNPRAGAGKRGKQYQIWVNVMNPLGIPLPMWYAPKKRYKQDELRDVWNARGALGWPSKYPNRNAYRNQSRNATQSAGKRSQKIASKRGTKLPGQAPSVSKVKLDLRAPATTAKARAIIEAMAQHGGAPATSIPAQPDGVDAAAAGKLALFIPGISKASAGTLVATEAQRLPPKILKKGKTMKDCSHLYEFGGPEATGLRVHYAAVTNLAIAAAAACNVVAQQGGRVNMLAFYVFTQVGVAAQASGQLAQVNVNSMPLNLSTVPVGNTISWGNLGGGKVGRYIGELVLNNNDTVGSVVTNLNAAAVTVLTECWFDPNPDV